MSTPLSPNLSGQWTDSSPPLPKIGIRYPEVWVSEGPCVVTGPKSDDRRTSPVTKSLRISGTHCGHTR